MLSIGNVVVILGDVIVDELRGFGRSSERSDIGNGIIVDGEEGKNEIKKIG